MPMRGIQDFFANLPQLDNQKLEGWINGKKEAAVEQSSAAWRALAGPKQAPQQPARAAKPMIGAAAESATFAEAWKVFQSTNARLRDPRVLPALLRRCGPDASLRGEVWLHCLGLDAATIASARASALEALREPEPSADAAERSDASAPSAGAAKRSDDSAEAGRLASADAAERSDASTADPAVTDAEAAEDAAAASEASATAADAGAHARGASAAGAAGARLVAEELDSWPEAALLPETRDGALPDGLGDLIDADVQRTFRGQADFEAIRGHARLRRVLRRFAVVEPELGYCQSLNFVAAVFLLVLQSEPAALCALRQTLVRLGTKCWYTDGMRQLRADTAVLEDLVRDQLPGLHEVFKRHSFDLLFVVSKWFLCLFATALEGDTLYRAWDLVLCDGIEAVMRLSLVLLARRAERGEFARSMDDLIFIFQEVWPERNPDALIKDAYSPSIVGQFNRTELAQRRQSALKKISSDDVRQEMRTQRLWRGGVRPASVLSR